MKFITISVIKRRNYGTNYATPQHYTANAEMRHTTTNENRPPQLSNQERRPY
jgi:hypothetical protein